MLKNLPEYIVTGLALVLSIKELKEGSEQNAIYKDLYTQTMADLKQEQQHTASLRAEVLQSHVSNVDLLQNIRELRQELEESERELTCLLDKLAEHGLILDEKGNIVEATEDSDEEDLEETEEDLDEI